VVDVLVSDAVVHARFLRELLDRRLVQKWMPRRLAPQTRLLVIAVGIMAVFGYFAEKSKAPRQPGHDMTQIPAPSGFGWAWECDECDFVTADRSEARYHYDETSEADDEAQAGTIHASTTTLKMASSLVGRAASPQPTQPPHIVIRRIRGTMRTAIP
jgi:hypothetical protein